MPEDIVGNIIVSSSTHCIFNNNLSMVNTTQWEKREREREDIMPSNIIILFDIYYSKIMIIFLIAMKIYVINFM